MKRVNWLIAAVLFNITLVNAQLGSPVLKTSSTPSVVTAALLSE